ncbi:hypothetical protein [Brevundimonas sp.]|uniref:hypothetical protein n=1 Tax=Brevundimonas sp. TaxID=1871086 RepID=UPI0035B04A66
MLSISTPKTLSGIKSLANTIRREKGIPHYQALDEAARRAGSENWAHALRYFPSTSPTTAYWCEFVVHWWDRDDRTAGAEHLRLPITMPLSKLVTQERLLRASYIGGFSKEGTEYLVDRSMRAPSKSTATWQAMRAARTLQFMEATGLRPSASRLRHHPEGRWELRVPGYDHGTKWFSPLNRTYLLIDEPYGARDNDLERAEWAARYGRQIVRPPWGGMHNPDGGTVAYLIAEQGIDLANVCKAVEGLEAAQTSWISSSMTFEGW